MELSETKHTEAKVGSNRQNKLFKLFQLGYFLPYNNWFFMIFLSDNLYKKSFPIIKVNP